MTIAVKGPFGERQSVERAVDDLINEERWGKSTDPEGAGTSKHHAARDQGCGVGIDRRPEGGSGRPAGLTGGKK